MMKTAMNSKSKSNLFLKKDVPLDDIEAIIEMKKPILIFEDLPESREGYTKGRN